jgi:hypothetical protein
MATASSGSDAEPFRKVFMCISKIGCIPCDGVEGRAEHAAFYEMNFPFLRDKLGLKAKKRRFLRNETGLCVTSLTLGGVVGEI